jgi:hypothetical protein
MEREPHGGERPAEGRERGLRRAVLVQVALRGGAGGYQPRGADRRGPCRVLHDGAHGPAVPRAHHADPHPHRGEVTLEKVGDAFTITKIALSTEAEIPGIDDATFQKHALDAKRDCPVSKALAGTEIHLDAKLL